MCRRAKGEKYVKVLVFSDSHGYNMAMAYAIEREKPDAVIHLGDHTDDADDIRRAVTAVLDEGWRTGDIKQSDTPADKLVGTAQMGDLVVSRL